MAENVNPLGTVKFEFSNQAKRSIIVKKISSILIKNPGSTNVLLKSDVLDKKSEKGTSWAARYLLLNTKYLKYYYSEENYL